MLVLVAGATSLPIVALHGIATPGELGVIATLVALLILIMEPACVAMLVGRLWTVDFDEERFEPSRLSVDSWCA